MRVLIQRVSRAQVRVEEGQLGAIGHGLLLLVGVGRDDATADATRLAARIARMRVFPDQAGRMNLSLLDTGGAALVVSQFTLYADTSRGNRPGFGAAAEPAHAAELVGRVADELRLLGVPVEVGRFGAHMEVELVNDGPVTIWVEDG